MRMGRWPLRHDLIAVMQKYLTNQPLGVNRQVCPDQSMCRCFEIFLHKPIYERNLHLELDGAAEVCAALAKSDRVSEWAYIDVYYFNTYQNLANVSHKVVGVAEVIVRREILSMLRNKHAPASEYPRHWRFIQGHKDQLDSRAPLSW